MTDIVPDASVEMNGNKTVVAAADSDLDTLDNLEERFAAMLESDGYREGLEAGRKAGLEEGYSLGATEGAKRGAELGYLHGYTLTFKHIYTRDSTSPASTPSKLEKILNDVLKLIDEFPRTNETNCEEKLAKIRVKFRQAFVNVPHHVECRGD